MKIYNVRYNRSCEHFQVIKISVICNVPLKFAMH